MTEGRRHSLRRAYLRLGTGELAAAGSFTFVAAAVILPRLQDAGEEVALWGAVGPLLLVLVQAGIYWLLARSWVARGTMPATMGFAYRGLRMLDVVILMAGLAIVLMSRPEDAGATLLVLAIWLFALIEYVN